MDSLDLRTGVEAIRRKHRPYPGKHRFTEFMLTVITTYSQKPMDSSVE